jgi:hypothetical protein
VELAALEARLSNTDGLRPRLQTDARAELTADGKPVTRVSGRRKTLTRGSRSHAAVCASFPAVGVGWCPGFGLPRKTRTDTRSEGIRRLATTRSAIRNGCTRLDSTGVPGRPNRPCAVRCTFW